MQGKAGVKWYAWLLRVHVWVFEVSAVHLLFARWWLPVSYCRAEETAPLNKEVFVFSCRT